MENVNERGVSFYKQMREALATQTICARDFWVVEDEAL